MTTTSTNSNTSSSTSIDYSISREVPDTIVSVEDIKLHFKKNVYGNDCYPLRYKGREYIFERLKWVRSLPKGIEDSSAAEFVEKKKIWDVMNSTVYQYYISYTALTSSAKSKYGFLLKEEGHVYLEISRNINIIKELYLSCFLYFKYNSLLAGAFCKQIIMDTVTLFSACERIKIDIIGHLTCCELYTSYLVKFKKYRERKILMVTLNYNQEIFTHQEGIVFKKKVDDLRSPSRRADTNYTLYGFPVVLFPLESNKTLYNLTLSFKKGNTLVKTYQIDSYHIFNDIVDNMEIYQKYGVHNGICPQNISYSNKTGKYYLVSYSSFTKDRLPSGYKRKTFLKKWKSQVKRYHCVTNVKYDLLELGFVFNWIEMKKLKLQSSVKTPVTRNLKDYFKYVNELDSNTVVDDKIQIDLGKILRRLDRTKEFNEPIY